MAESGTINKSGCGNFNSINLYLNWITKRGQTWGDRKRPSFKENNLPHKEVKSENESLWTGDRGGGRKKVSSIPQVSMARDRRTNNLSASTLLLYTPRTAL